MEKKQAASVVTGHWFANSENCEHGSRQIACVGTQGTRDSKIRRALLRVGTVGSPSFCERRRSKSKGEERSDARRTIIQN